MKKSIAILLSLVLIMGIVSIASASAATGSSVIVGNKTYEVKKGGTFTYTLNLTTSKEIENGQFIIYYPAEVVKVKTLKIDTDFLGVTPISNYNIPNYPGEIDINFSKVDPSNPNKGIDFTKKHKICDVTFEVIGTGSGKIYVSDKAEEIVFADVNGKDVKAVFEGVISGASTQSSSTAKKTTTTKKKNTIKVTAAKKTVKLKKLKKKSQTIKALKVKNAKGKVTYKIVKKGTTAKIKKFVKISKKGVITFKKWKKAKKGTYNIKVTVTAAGNKSYKKGSKSVTVKVKVK